MATISRENEGTITAEHLRSILDYDPETGLFRWKDTTSPNAHNGDIAGSVRPDGRRDIRIGYIRFLASRLAWLYVKGEWPDRYVDHIDRDKANDAFANLRLADPHQNRMNSGVRSDSKLRLRNISAHRNLFVVRFCKDRKTIYRNSFQSLEDAVRARDAILPSICGSFIPSSPDI